jgi:hypothetical protein
VPDVPNSTAFAVVFTAPLPIAIPFAPVADALEPIASESVPVALALTPIAVLPDPVFATAATPSANASMLAADAD